MLRSIFADAGAAGPALGQEGGLSLGVLPRLAEGLVLLPPRPSNSKRRLALLYYIIDILRLRSLLVWTSGLRWRMVRLGGHAAWLTGHMAGPLGPQVRDAQDAIGVAHEVINGLFHQIVRTRVHGFDS